MIYVNRPVKASVAMVFLLSLAAQSFWFAIIKVDGFYVGQRFWTNQWNFRSRNKKSFPLWMFHHSLAECVFSSCGYREPIIITQWNSAFHVTNKYPIFKKTHCKKRRKMEKIQFLCMLQWYVAESNGWFAYFFRYQFIQLIYWLSQRPKLQFYVW